MKERFNLGLMPIVVCLRNHLGKILLTIARKPRWRCRLEMIHCLSAFFYSTNANNISLSKPKLLAWLPATYAIFVVVIVDDVVVVVFVVVVAVVVKVVIDVVTVVVVVFVVTVFVVVVVKQSLLSLLMFL
jgi:hypothetical protein